MEGSIRVHCRNRASCYAAERLGCGEESPNSVQGYAVIDALLGFVDCGKRSVSLTIFVRAYSGETILRPDSVSTGNI